jgi:hypothetical protein
MRAKSPRAGDFFMRNLQDESEFELYSVADVCRWQELSEKNFIHDE